jgi:hypothetical protein
VHHELTWPDGRPVAESASAGQQRFAPATPPVGLAKGDRRAFRVLDGGRKED